MCETLLVVCILLSGSLCLVCETLLVVCISLSGSLCLVCETHSCGCISLSGSLCLVCETYSFVAYHMFFFIWASVNTKVPLILHTKFQPNIPSHFGDIDQNARVDVNFLGQRKFSYGHCDLIRLQIFFHFDINQHQCPTNTSKISAKYT